MIIALIITGITIGVLLFFIVYQWNPIKKKLPFNKDKKKQMSAPEQSENHVQKSSERPQKELGKNKWLHTTDSFGKMEKGKVL